MPTVSASTVETLLNITSIDAEKIESWIDQAIDMLNLEGADIPNMSGTAGNKTVSLESKERGAVNLVVKVVYQEFYKDIETSTIEGMTLSTPDWMGNPAVRAAVKEAARRLSELDVSRG